MGSLKPEKKVLIFAGTTEGRKIAEYLAGHAVRVHICVATEYGESLLPEGGSVTVSHDRMDQIQMERFMEEFKPDYVVDATHPYANEATRNVKEACRSCERAYLRLIRESSEADGCIYTDSVEEAVAFLSRTKGNILAATGSKEILAYTRLEDYKERLYARVLSVADVAEKCEQLGIRGRHLICMQGPFSVEMNIALLREYNIEWFVTKESGRAGGFPEKREAAKQAGARLVVVGRPEKDETGYTLEELRELLGKQLGLTGKSDNGQREIALVGIGTGGRDQLTVRAKEICAQAELIIGAERIVRAAALDGQDVFYEYRTAEIVDHIKKHPEYKSIAVVFSGDVGFYSGAKGLLSVLREDESFGWTDDHETDTKLRSDSEKDTGKRTVIEVVPGISSVVYFCAKLHISWEDAALISMHGKTASIMSVIRGHEKTIALVSNADGIRRLGTEMEEYGYGDLTVCVGESLSGSDEKFTQLAADELCSYKGSDLAVLYIYNPEGGKHRMNGIPDTAFIRGNVPMTKEEVRSVSLSKLCLKRDSIVYDIGAGTGSVAVEAAICAAGGIVYAVESNEEAVSLIAKNRRKFKTDNLKIIRGEAPAALEGLPAPDCVFIGGSGGRLKEIIGEITNIFLKALKENADMYTDMHVVINTITLETLSEAVQCLKALKGNAEVKVQEEEIVQLSVAKSKNIGNYHMMTGQNPVFIISFCVVSAKERKSS